MIGINMKILNKNKGLTLIEILVTVLIFSIIIGAAIGVFVSAIKLQRYNLTHQQLLSQVSFAVEYMDRTIRMAQKDDDTCFGTSNYNPNTGINDNIQFKTYHDQCWRFFLENGQLKIDRDGEEYDLTSDNFEVSNFNVVVSGDISGESPNLQPKVTIFIEIEAKDSGQQPRIKIQTTISQRNLDL